MSFTGIGTAFGSFFGTNDLEDRFNQAIEQLNAFKAQADVSLSGFRQKGQTTFDRGMSELTSPTMAPDLAQLRASLMTQISTGLSPFAQLQMEDANRFLENRAISTGNLRSGAVGLQRAELGRRVVADEFGRAMQVLDTMGKRDITAANMFLNTSLGFGQNENYALRSYGDAVSQIAGAYVGLGSAQQQKSAALGAGLGGLTDTAVGAGATYYTGGVNALMQSLGWPPSTTAPAKT